MHTVLLNVCVGSAWFAYSTSSLTLYIAMAGRIVPAIATSNAVVAGVMGMCDRCDVAIEGDW